MKELPTIVTFPEFALFVNGTPVKLSKTGYEILAYLVNAQGRNVHNDELIKNVLKREKSERSKVLLRVTWHKLKKDLEDYSAGDIIRSLQGGRWRCAVPWNYYCDMDQLTQGSKLQSARYVDDYLKPYDWAADKRRQLNQLAEYYRNAA